MSFARWIFLIAGIYGVLAIAPMFFLEGRFSGGESAGDHASGVLLRLCWCDAGLAIRFPRHSERSAAVSLVDVAGDV
jgi:hypothetical protein